MGFESINQHFIFLAGEGWWLDFESIDQPGQLSEVERNPKMSMSLFWLERGGGWGSSPSTSLADHQKLEHNPKMRISFFWLERGGRQSSSSSTSLVDHQKLNVIQKRACHFFGWRGVVDGVRVHQPAWPIIRSWNVIQKRAFHFLAGEGWWMGLESINQPGPSSEVERNPKMSNSFFWLERGGGWGLSPSTSPAHHQKLNVIQK